MLNIPISTTWICTELMQIASGREDQEAFTDDSEGHKSEFPSRITLESFTEHGECTPGLSVYFNIPCIVLAMFGKFRVAIPLVFFCRVLAIQLR
jgi:hypothetical protein